MKQFLFLFLLVTEKISLIKGITKREPKKEKEKEIQRGKPKEEEGTGALQPSSPLKQQLNETRAERKC